MNAIAPRQNSGATTLNAVTATAEIMHKEMYNVIDVDV